MVDLVVAHRSESDRPLWSPPKNLLQAFVHQIRELSCVVLPEAQCERSALNLEVVSMRCGAQSELLLAFRLGRRIESITKEHRRCRSAHPASVLAAGGLYVGLPCFASGD